MGHFLDHFLDHCTTVYRHVRKGAVQVTDTKEVFGDNFSLCLGPKGKVFSTWYYDDPKNSLTTSGVGPASYYV